MSNETVVAQGPTKPASGGLIFAFVLSYLGVWMAALTPIFVSLPMRVRQVDPVNSVSDLSLILSAGALLALVSNPFFGRLSDRTTSRMGMRRPWLILGAFTGTIGVAVISLVPSIIAIAIGWALAQIAVNILLAVTTAILPDQIPSSQRGKVSGYLSMCMSIAPTVGVFIAKQFTYSMFWTFMTPALIMLVTALLLAAVLPDRHIRKEDVPPYSFKEFVLSFWVNPVKHADFGWIWASRFMRFIGLATLQGFEAYFVTDFLHKTRAEVAGVLLISTLTMAVTGFIGSNLAGYISDFTKKRKLIHIIGSLIFAVGLLLIAFSFDLKMFYIAAAFCGFGQGAFIALDFAIVSEVMPEGGAAKNMGVFNIANSLPQIIAPLLAPFVLGIGGGESNYTALFLVAAIAAVIGTALVPLVRKVN